MMTSKHIHVAFLEGGISAEDYAGLLQYAINHASVDDFFNSWARETSECLYPHPVFTSYTYYPIFDRWLIGEMTDERFVAEFEGALKRGDVKSWFEVWVKLQIGGWLR